VVRIEDLSLKNQLSYISQTNILIGMHSTAMTYIMFLPKQAGVIELFPKDTLTTNNQYKIIARWRSYNLFCFAPKEYLASYSYYYYWLSSIHVYEAQMSEMIPPMVISLVPCHPLDFLISE
jgi:hypothetical protein